MCAQGLWLASGRCEAGCPVGSGWPMPALYALLGLAVATAPTRLVPRRRFRLPWPWLSLAGVYRLALQLWSGQTMSHRRLGLMATDANEFETAITHLERAYQGNPSHPASIKGLGLAYLWAGRLDEAELLLKDVPWICEELNTWAWWWGTQGQDDLAGHARLLAERICAESRCRYKSLDVAAMDAKGIAAR